jgi:hypothetical protein
MRRHHSASNSRKRRGFGVVPFVDAWCQPGISDVRLEWWWRADAAATAPPPCCKPERPAVRDETDRPTMPPGNKGGTRAGARAVRPRRTAELDRVRVSPPSPLCFPSAVAPTAIRSARRRRNAAVPSSRLPISRLAVTRLLSSLPSYGVSSVAALDVRLGDPAFRLRAYLEGEESIAIEDASSEVAVAMARRRVPDACISRRIFGRRRAPARRR